MYNNLTFLAIITARGGSKRLPGKNVKLLGGKPLVAWTIDAAKKSKFIDRCILSSEDDEIISVSKNQGCEVPFVRPAELATDSAKSADVIVHAISQVERHDYIVVLQPTSPFRTLEDLDNAISLCVDSNASSLVSVRKIRENPEWMCYPTNGCEFNFLSPNLPVNTNDLRILNGAIYIANTEWFIKNMTFEGDGTIMYEMPWERSIDIDTEQDFRFAEFLLQP